MKNLVLADTLITQDWEFVQGLEQSTGEDWTVMSWDNAGLNKNKLSKIKRVFGYFTHAFEVFWIRKKFDQIVAWQQFYGIIYALMCCLFHVKKSNLMIVMTFIYKEKRGIIGKIYKKYMSKAVNSKYIDKLIVFSHKEVEYYNSIFKPSTEKFIYFPLGISSNIVQGETTLDVRTPFLLSVGRSNRDYKFLLECIKSMPYQFVIITDSIDNKTNLPSNVRLLDNVRGDEYLKILKKSTAVLIPLEDPNISSGQLVMLQAMQYMKPIVITESNTTGDYVKNSYNAVVCQKNLKDFRIGIERIMSDSDLRERIIQNGYKKFQNTFSLSALGKNVGSCIGELSFNKKKDVFL